MDKKLKIIAPDLVMKKAREKRVSKNELARLVEITPQALQVFTQAYDCSVSRLVDYSQALDYNFFKEIADELNIELPHSKSEQAIIDKMERMKAEMEELKLELKLKNREIETLERSISLMGSR